MKRYAVSSLAMTSHSKPQSNASSPSKNTNKAKLLQMIAELKREKNNYEKKNQLLIQNTQLIDLQNQKIKDAIIHRKIHYQQVVDKYTQSSKTLKAEFESNQKMSKIYSSYKNKAKMVKQTNNDSTYITSEMTKVENEINGIRRSATRLINRFSVSKKKVYIYRILISLDSKLINVNKLFTKQVKNCFSANESNPRLFKPSNLNKLQQKVEKGDEIKKELFLPNEKEEEKKTATTKLIINSISNDFERFLTIYNHFFTVKPSQKSMAKQALKMSKKDENGNLVFEMPKVLNFSDEINELQRISEIEDLDYLNDTERDERFKRIKSFFIPGKYPVYDSEESTESEQEDMQEPEGKPLTILQLEPLLFDSDHCSEKVDKIVDKKIVKTRKKNIKKPIKSKNQKVAKLDVSVQFSNSKTNIKPKEEQEKNEEKEQGIQVSGNFSRSFLQHSATKVYTKQCKTAIGNELITEFPLEEIEEKSDESDLSDSDSDSYNLEESATSALFQKKEEKHCKTSNGGEVTSKFRMEELEEEIEDENKQDRFNGHTKPINSDKINRQDVCIDHTKIDLKATKPIKSVITSKQDKIIDAQKIRQQVEQDAKSKYITDPKMKQPQQLSRQDACIDHTKVNLKTETTKQIKTDKVNNKEQPRQVEPIKTMNHDLRPQSVHLPKSQPRPDSKIRPKSAEKELVTEHRPNKLEKSFNSPSKQPLNSRKINNEDLKKTSKTEQNKNSFSHLIDTLKNMQNQDEEFYESATEECTTSEILLSEIFEKSDKRIEIENSIHEITKNTETAKESIFLLDLSSESPNSPRSPTQPPEFKPFSSVAPKPKQPQQKINTDSSSSRLIQPKKEEQNEKQQQQQQSSFRLAQLKKEEKEKEKEPLHVTIKAVPPRPFTKKPDQKQFKFNSGKKSPSKEPKKETKMAKKSQKETQNPQNVKPKAASVKQNEKEEENKTTNKTSLSKLIQTLKTLQQSCGEYSESAADDSAMFEHSMSEVGDESDKAIRTEKFLLANMPEVIFSTESEQIENEDTNAVTLSLLDLDMESESASSPRSSTRSSKFDLAATSTSTKSTTATKASITAKPKPPQQSAANSSPLRFSQPIKEQQQPHEKTQQQQQKQETLTPSSPRLNQTKKEQVQQQKQTPATSSSSLSSSPQQKKELMKQQKQAPVVSSSSLSRFPQPKKELMQQEQKSQIEKAETPNTVHVHVPKGRPNSSARQTKNTEEVNPVSEITINKIREESEKAIKAAKSLLASQVEKKEKPKVSLSLLDLEGESESVKSPRSQARSSKFERLLRTKPNQAEQPLLDQPKKEQQQPQPTIKPSSSLLEQQPQQEIKTTKSTSLLLNQPKKEQQQPQPTIKPSSSLLDQPKKEQPQQELKTIKSTSSRLEQLKKEQQKQEQERAQFRVTIEATPPQTKTKTTEKVEVYKPLSKTQPSPKNFLSSDTKRILKSSKENESSLYKASNTKQFLSSDKISSDEPEKFDKNKNSFSHLIQVLKNIQNDDVESCESAADESAMFEYSMNEILNGSDKAIRTEKFLLANMPEVMISTESEQIENEDAAKTTFSLLDLELESESANSPRSSTRPSKFNLTTTSTTTATATTAKPKPPQQSATNSSPLRFSLPKKEKQPQQQQKQATLTPSSPRLNQPIKEQSQLQKEVKESSCHLSQPKKERPQSEAKTYKLSINDELVDSEPKSPKKEEVATSKVSNTKPPVRSPKENKPAFKSTYDRSVFYTSTNSLSILNDECSSDDEKVHITVTLKDIGLEGLDSGSPKKIEPKPKKERSASVSSNVKSKPKKCQKQASLLDSAQKAQKYQAVKPKTPSKHSQKFNGSNKSIDYSQEEKSPRRYYMDITEKLPPSLDCNHVPSIL